VISDSIDDWRDANDLARVNGAESEYYLKLPIPYRPRNGNLQHVSELLQIRGITPEIYFGHDDKPGLVDLVTVRSRGVTININTASKLVLQAVGMADAEVGNILQSRVPQPYAAVPAIYAARGARFTVNSATFRIESEGVIAGEPRARLLAVVQRTTTTATPALTGTGSTSSSTSGAGSAPALIIYSWTPLPPKARVQEAKATKTK